MSIFRVREAHENDVEGIAKVRVDTWRATYRGIMPDDFIDGMSYKATAEMWRKSFWENRKPGVAPFVAEYASEGIVGIAVCGPEQSQDTVYRGEVYVLYVFPQYQRQGIGRALVVACVDYLVQQLGVETMLIWAAAESPYRRFYESLGGRVVREKSKEIGGKMILEVGYGWEEIHQFTMM